MGALVDAGARLGFPWDGLAEAVEERQEAERAAGFALDGGSEAEIAAAGFELETAMMAEKRCRGDVADAFLLMMQGAIDERFTELWAKVVSFAVKAEWRREVQRFFSTQPGGATWAAGLERTVRELTEENAQLKRAVARLGAETWELANWIARLERGGETHTTTGGPEHGTGSEGQGEADAAARGPADGGRKAG